MRAHRLTGCAMAALFVLLPDAFALGQTALSVTGGLNLASAASSRPDDRDDGIGSLTRMVAGVSAATPLTTGGWRVQLGAAYAQKGFEFGIAEFAMDYVELAAMLDRPLPLGDAASVHLLAGPALGFQVSCQVKDQSRSQDCPSEGVSAFDFGVVAGFDFEVGLSDSLGLLVGMSYNLGLVALLDEETYTTRSRTLTLRSGVTFPIR